MPTYKEILKEYAERLLDLTRRNRLLNTTKRISGIRFYDDASVFLQKHWNTGANQDPRLDGLQFSYPLLEEYEHEQRTLQNKKEEKQLLIYNEPKKEYQIFCDPWGIKLKNIIERFRLDTKRKFEEHGLHTLFLAVGMLRWNQNPIARRSSEKAIGAGAYDYNAPLVLIPVNIHALKKPKGAKIALDLDFCEIRSNPFINIFFQKKEGLQFTVVPSFTLDNANNVPDIAQFLDSVKRNMEKCDIREFVIEPSVILAQFSFHGERMFRDIIEHEEIFTNHPVIQGICGDKTIAQNSEFFNIPDGLDAIDTIFDAENDNTILEADSTQLEAIYTAKSGKHIVVTGPPGTGKSQTIVNLIADYAARGKKVLFLCAKTVALEVVYKRLKESKVPHIALPLYIHNQNKKDFIKQIAKEWRERKRSLFTIYTSKTKDILSQRDKVRTQLNQYTKSLLKPRGKMNISVWQTHGKKAQAHLSSPVAIPLTEKVLNSVNEAELENKERSINTFSKFWSIFKEEDSHVWKDLKVGSFAPGLAEEINQLIKGFHIVLTQILEVSKPLLDCCDHRYITADFLVEILEDLRSRLNILDSCISSYGKNEIGVYELHNELKTIQEQTNGLIAKYMDVVEKLKQKPDNLPPDFTSTDTLQNFKQCLQNIEPYSSTSVGAVLNALYDIESIIRALNRFQGCFNIGKEEEDATARSVLRWLAKAAGFEKIPFWNNEFSQKNKIARIIPQLKELLPSGIRKGDVERALQEMHVKYKEIAYEDLSSVAKNFAQRYKTWLRYFSKQYKSDIQKTASFLIGNHKLSYKKAQSILQLLEDYFKETQFLQDRISMLQNIGINNVREFVEWQSLCDGLNEIMEALEELHALTVPEWLNKRLQNNFSETQKLLIANQENARDIYTLCAELKKELSDLFNNIFDKSLDEAAAFLSKLEGSLKQVQSIADRHVFLQYILPYGAEEARKEVDTVTILYQLRNEYKNCNHALFSNAPQNIDDLVAEPPYFAELSNKVGSFIHTISNGQAHTLQFFSQCVNKVDGLVLQKALYSFDEGIKRMKEHFDTRTYQQVGATSLFGDMQAKQESLHEIDDWLSYRKAYIACEKYNLISYLEYARDNNISAQNLSRAYLASFWNKWLQECHEEDPELRISTTEQAEKVKHFQGLDSKGQSENVNFLQNHCGYCGSVEYCDETEVIRHQANLKTRHKPIRQIVPEIVRTLQEIKPCWLMSPLSLSTFVPMDSKIKFDVVIFDEASQLKTEEALGGIARSNQVIVVGDKKQLPPTAFFDTIVSGTTDEEDEIHDETDFQSILDVLSAKLDEKKYQKMLKWHYRSKYESLIAFSNYHFYDNKLVTFPANDTSNLGLEFNYRKDIYDRGKTRANRGEAVRVIERCIEIIKEYPQKTFGVIAMSKAQEETIRAALENKAKNNEIDEKTFELLDESNTIPIDEKRPEETFFIKNLESVQGDERDIMLLSVGYGYDETGTMQNQFGPINKQGGERRLNVAITRARERMIVLTSIKHTDIKGDLHGSIGARLLRDYLRYVEKYPEEGKKALFTEDDVMQEDILRETESPFEDAVKESLEGRGYKVGKQVGVSGYRIDLAIIHPNDSGKYILGIECDGATYHETRCARERDRLRQEILEHRGWNIYRIWSTHWVRNSESILKDIDEEVKMLLSKG